MVRTKEFRVVKCGSYFLLGASPPVVQWSGRRAGWQKTVWCKSCTSWELSEATCTHILHPSICMGPDRVIMTTFDIPFTSQTRIWLRKPSWEALRTRWQAEVLLCLLLSTFSSVCLDWMNLYVWEWEGWSAGLIFMGLKWHRESVRMWLMTAFFPSLSANWLFSIGRIMLIKEAKMYSVWFVVLYRQITMGHFVITFKQGVYLFNISGWKWGSITPVRIANSHVTRSKPKMAAHRD